MRVTNIAILDKGDSLGGTWRGSTPTRAARATFPRWLVPNGLRGVGVVGAAVVPVVAVGVGVGEILLTCSLPVLTWR